MTTDDPLVNTEWLADNLDRPDLRILDVRGYVRTTPIGDDGRQQAEYVGAPEEYAQGHIPGAQYVDWTRDIIDPNDPVPAQVASAEQFAALCGRLGIGNDSEVVVYDHGVAQFATRLWWVFGLYGHDRVRVLDGGYERWTAEGRPATTDVPHFPPAQFTPHPRPQRRATAEQVLALIQDPERPRATTLVDARDRGQYTGAIYRGERAGHIPGAIHVHSHTMLTAPRGPFTDLDTARETLARAGLPVDDAGAPVVAYCNGGVAATVVLFTLSRLGHDPDKLVNYDGSWNEWGNRADLPATRHET